MWQRYFGPLAKIVGIDIEPSCRKHEAPGIFVRIGDQGDPAFLAKVIEEFGIPDVVLDDGSHKMEHVQKTFDFLYPRLPKNGVYMIEDLHTAYWNDYGGGLKAPTSFIEFAKGCIDRLNADHTRGAVTPDDLITRNTTGISFYDSIVVFEKGQAFRKEPFRTGK
jgi:hypothetical protein